MVGTFSSSDKNWHLDYFDRCPHCYRHSTLEVIATGKSPSLNECGVIFYCRDCRKLSFADLALVGEVLRSDDTKLIASYPDPKALPLPKGIEAYFPKFYQIYTQAHFADLEGMSEIVGMAYRKALENLVKNYLIDILPDEKDVILKEPLGKSINRIEYPRIKALAKVAAWIGNDATHLVERNPELGVGDMKNFILALCHLILAERAGDKAAEYVNRE